MVLAQVCATWPLVVFSVLSCLHGPKVAIIALNTRGLFCIIYPQSTFNNLVLIG
jgi:hypothetical protein